MTCKDNTGIIYTLSAKCRDCYRCLRMCPVKAIDVIDGQAYVDSDRCILCGKCIKECPQGAKTYRNDIGSVINLIKSSNRVVASIAPSYASFYNLEQVKKIPSVLRKLGFWKILNTAEAVDAVLNESDNYLKEHSEDGSICTACPVVINYIEVYKSNLVENIIPVVSPMIAHGKNLKEIYGDDIKVVFIGPCIGKKKEAQRDEFKGIIDTVLTFKELDDWIKTENIDLMFCEDSDFDKNFRSKKQGIFPLSGSSFELKKLSEKDEGHITQKKLSVSGKRVLELFAIDYLKFNVIEALFCEEGCINGPGTDDEKNIFDRKLNLLEFYRKEKDDLNLPKAIINNLRTGYYKKSNNFASEIPEDKIREIFAMTGKEDEEHRLNCGACGYNSCEEKAKAVFLGRAEAQMCIPYMRRLAEKKTDIILDTIPYGLVLLDEKLKIVFMNTAFREFFLCSNDTLGRGISYLFDSDGYERLSSKKINQYNSLVKFNGNEYHQHIYTLKEQDQFVGIYSKVLPNMFDEDKMFKMKEQVIHKVLELRDQQIKMSHDLALLLGDNSAKVEEILWRLMNIYE